MSAMPDSTLANPEQLIADLRRQLAECKAERADGLERETATAEILQVINSSPGDLPQVFDAMLDKALRLCEASLGHLLTYDGERFSGVATRGDPKFYEWFHGIGSFVPEPGSTNERIVKGESIIEVRDLADDPASKPENPIRRALIEVGGFRTALSVALRKEQSLLGVLHIVRQEVRPFSDKQIALLQNFAAQAVIAMENARLITETREALEQQTATAEVLQVINSSPGDLAPVFDAMLEKATRLCEASFGMMYTYDGERFHPAATLGVPDALAEWQERGRLVFGPGTGPAQMAGGEDLVHTVDLMTSDVYQRGDPARRALVDLGGARTHLIVALRKDRELLGTIAVYRQEVRPFTEKQSALLQNFAAQAVIAMENARLITETREALEQQTATAEVLQVINSSPGDLAPVFDAMLEKAHTLCGAAHGSLQLYDGENLHAVATNAVSDEFADILRQGYRAANSPASQALIHGKPFAHIADCAEIDHPVFRSAAELAGIRTVLFVPLRKDGAFLGLISAARLEVRPFSEKEIALLQNFAAQAVIAMENARLLNETREALEQQTATAEVLQVINSSPGDLKPVFDSILERSHRLCGIAFGALQLSDGGKFRSVAVRGLADSLVELLQQPFEPVPGSPPARLLGGERIVHIADMAELANQRSDDARAQAAAEHGFRTALFVPLRKDADLLGYIVAFRQEVQPYSEKEIALLENFAAQAVIAMENARLITETREALEQQTATAEVLGVINSSPGDLAPVFDALLDKAMHLCESAFGGLTSYDGERFHTLATRGLPPTLVEVFREAWTAGSGSYHQRLIDGELLVHTDFGVQNPERRAHPQSRGIMEIGGARTGLLIALRKDETLLGSLFFYRREVCPYTDQQIALLQSFAAQAVIAMENARLITETQEALEQQTATAEVLGVINSSPGDLTPVFDAMLEKATRLCEAPFGNLRIWDGESFHVGAVHGEPPFSQWARQRGSFRPNRDSSPLARIVEGEPVVYLADALDDEGYRTSSGFREMVDASGIRSAVTVALRKDETLLGTITVYRQEVRPFTEKQIALLQNFAAQAVIAMENARLLDEIRQRQQELRVTFDNMVDGVAMFDEAMHLAAWNRNFQELLQLPDELLAKRPDFDTYIRYLVERGEFGETDPEKEIARLRARLGDHYSFERTRPDGTVIEVRHNPMAGGGIVLIYSDITERKRSEAEIKAARDAAEAAYRDLKAAQVSLIQAEKMASLGQLTAGIAHEIKNPLNFVNNFAGLSVELLDELKETASPAISALDDEKRAEIDETIEMLSGNLDKIAEHGRRADNIVTSMLEHSRGSSGERRSVDLNALVEEALNLAYHGGRAKDQSFNITLERDYPDALAQIEVVPQDITRVCLNLFGNGFYAATKRQKEGSDASFKPTLKVSTRDLGEAVEIRVRDNGIGIAPEIKDKLFQPFFTTKPTGEGTGLGLSISYDIVTQQHGGTITVDSRVGEFTEFNIRLPRAYRATTAEAAL
jgi:GAF domain-containing protein